MQYGRGAVPGSPRRFQPAGRRAARVRKNRIDSALGPVDNASMQAREEEDAYALGTGTPEIARLAQQSACWQAQLRDACAWAGIERGSKLLDLGCGPGFTSLDLAAWTGPEGSVLACDQSQRFLAFLAESIQDRDLCKIEIRPGAIEYLDVAPIHDAAYARWLLCWLPDPKRALQRIASGLRSGACLLIQDYMDWGAMSLLPGSSAFLNVKRACLASWRGKYTTDIVPELFELGPAAGFKVEAVRPIARLGAPGSPEWTWIGDFLHSYGAELVKSNQLSKQEYTAFQVEMRQREERGFGVLQTPTMADVVLRKVN